MNANEDRAALSDAVEIEALAADWFGRRQFWNWQLEDQVQLNVWLNAALAHRVAFWRLEAAWSRTERLAAVRELVHEQMMPDARQTGWFGKVRIVAGAAAILAILAFGAREAGFFQHAPQTYSTAFGETRTLKLADGSRIELNTDTVLRIDLSGRDRAAELDRGEAYFQITHNAAHPFFVTVGGDRITDLGTKFLIRQDGSRVQVTLVEGRARIDAAKSGAQTHSAVLMPGDIAVATPVSMSIIKGTSQELANTLSWRSGLLVFDNMTLGDAAAEFNRYNRMQLVIVGSSVGRTPIAGRFPINGVNRFAEVVKHVFGLHVQAGREMMVISR